ncbi:MAG: DUF2070 family protein [Conexivisphaerales archaeon]
MADDATTQIANHYKKLFSFPSLKTGLLLLIISCIFLSLPFYHYADLNLLPFVFLSFLTVILIISYVDVFLTSFSPISSLRRIFFAILFQLSPLLLFSFLSFVINLFTLFDFDTFLKMFIFWAFFTFNLRYFILYAVFYQKYLSSFIHALLLPFSLIVLLELYFKNTLNLPIVIIALIINLIFSVFISIYIKFIDNVGLSLLNVSSFKILSSYLYAWVCSDPTPLENLLEKNSIESKIETYKIDLVNCNKNVSLVIPGIHPGPFSPIGSYNLPYEIINFYNSQNVNSMVFHSPSSHEVNLPSKYQTEHYLNSLNNLYLISQGSFCSKPIKINKNKVTVNGLKFSDIILAFITFAPYGVEDLPTEIYEYVKGLESNGIKKVILVDAHNALGPIPTKEDIEDLKSCLTELIERLTKSPSYPFRYNFAQERSPVFEEIGPGGISCLALLIDNYHYIIYSIDSNNSVPNLRPVLEKELQKKGLSLIEVCTTDTHFSSGKILSEKGYYALGELSNLNHIVSMLVNMASELIDDLRAGAFKTYYCLSNLKILGRNQINTYSIFLNTVLSKVKKGAIILLMLILLLFSFFAVLIC